MPQPPEVNYQAWLGVPAFLNGMLGQYQGAKQAAAKTKADGEAQRQRDLLFQMKLKKGASGGGTDPMQLANFERALAQDYAKRGASYADNQRSFRTLEGAFKAGKDNGAQDLALIYSYIKMLDPGSVVREGEVGLSDQALGLWGYFKKLESRVTAGDTTVAAMLSKPMREEMYKFARKGMADTVRSQHDYERQFEDRLGNYETRIGLNKRAVVPEYLALGQEKRYSPELWGEAFGAPRTGSVSPQQGQGVDKKRLHQLLARKNAGEVLDAQEESYLQNGLSQMEP